MEQSCAHSCLMATRRVQPAPMSCCMQSWDRLVSEALTSFVVFSSLLYWGAVGYVGSGGHHYCLWCSAVETMGIEWSPFSLQSNLRSLLLWVHSLMVTGGQGASKGHPHPSLHVPRSTMAVWLGSMLCLNQAPRGFLKPLPQLLAPPSPGRDKTALTQHLAGCLPPHTRLSVALSPTTPRAGGEPKISVISPPHYGHSAADCDKEWGCYTDPSTAVPSTAALPVVPLLP